MGAILAIPAAIAAILVFFVGDNVLGLGGAGSQPSPVQPPTSLSSGSPSPLASKGRLLSDNPVRVVWTGDGEAIEVSWAPMSYDDLDRYWVDLYALYPEQVRVSLPTGPNEQLDTYKVIRPVADIKDYYEKFPGEKTPAVGPGETWRICVTGERMPAADGTVRPIEGSRQCSASFQIPRT